VRGVFWRSVFRFGLRWLWGVVDHFGRAVTILALIGIPTGAAATTELGWWAPVTAVGLVLLAALGEGAFRSWNALAKDVVSQEVLDQSRRAFAGQCFEWVAQVNRFVDAQRARDPGRRTGGLGAQLKAPPETDDRRRQREAQEGEAVALYIERYRDEGVRLFDALVAKGLIVPDTRDHVRSPRNLSDIWDAAHSVRTAAERLGTLLP
jgi:hypothetical protein